MTRTPDPPLGPFPDSKWTVLEVGLRMPLSPTQAAHGWSATLAVRARCECGTEALVRRYDLLRGKSTQCAACSSREQARAIAGVGPAARWSDGHRMSSHPLRDTWHQMMTRCYNARSKDYPRYGGRQPYPITVCPLWHDVRAFVEDIERLLGPRPEGMTLDRIRNGLGYKPSNVRWADDATQRANQGKSWAEMTISEQLAHSDKWKQEQLALRGA